MCSENKALICPFGFVYADCWFSDEAAQFYNNIEIKRNLSNALNDD